jgi:predicted site-specific integrase-resolvase
MTESAVQIGEAAALYDVAPSTLRWWEKQGILDPVRHADGRRRYDATDLPAAGPSPHRAHAARPVRGARPAHRGAAGGSG